VDHCWTYGLTLSDFFVSLGALSKLDSTTVVPEHSAFWHQIALQSRSSVEMQISPLIAVCGMAV
jgi:hypothetical protein